jgi:hypothetical protein
MAYYFCYAVDRDKRQQESGGVHACVCVCARVCTRACVCVHECARVRVCLLLARVGSILEHVEFQPLALCFMKLFRKVFELDI